MEPNWKMSFLIEMAMLGVWVCPVDPTTEPTKPPAAGALLRCHSMSYPADVHNIEFFWLGTTIFPIGKRLI